MSKAKVIFERHLTLLRTTAESVGLHFGDILMWALDNSDTPKHVKLANLLMTPDERVPHLINRYRVEFFEWLANQGIDQLDARRRGGQTRGEQRHSESIARQTKILEMESTLLATGCKSRGLNKRIAKELDEESEYVRKVRAGRSRTRKAAAS